jgi:multiple sugar transport system substrate-binding protein
MSLTSRPISRRAVLAGGLAGITLPWLLSACAPEGTGASSTATSLRYAFWGGESRIAKFAAIQDLYTKEFGVTFNREFAEFFPYWERFSTQIAARSLPDIVSMTEQQVGEYASQLEDLSPYIDSGKLDLSTWGQKYMDAGMVDGRFLQLFLGGTVPSFIYNKTALDAAGHTDDPNEWSWEQFSDVCVEIAKAGGQDRWGSSDGGGTSQQFDTFLHQKGKGNFVDGEIGWEPADLEEFLTLWADLRDAGGAPPFEITSEYSAGPFEDREIVRGFTVFQVGNHNHMPGLQGYTDGTLYNMTVPVVGRGERVAMNAGTYVSLAATGKGKDTAVDYLNWFINTEAAIEIFEAEYGGLPSADANDTLLPIVSDPARRALEFFKSVDEIAAVIPPWPPQAAQLLTLIQQANESVALGRESAEAAAQTCFEQLSAAVG